MAGFGAGPSAPADEAGGSGGDAKDEPTAFENFASDMEDAVEAADDAATGEPTGDESDDVAYMQEWRGNIESFESTRERVEETYGVDIGTISTGGRTVMDGLETAGSYGLTALGSGAAVTAGLAELGAAGLAGPAGWAVAAGILVWGGIKGWRNLVHLQREHERWRNRYNKAASDLCDLLDLVDPVVRRRFKIRLAEVIPLYTNTRDAIKPNKEDRGLIYIATWGDLTPGIAEDPDFRWTNGSGKRRNGIGDKFSGWEPGKKAAAMKAHAKGVQALVAAATPLSRNNRIRLVASVFSLAIGWAGNPFLGIENALPGTQYGTQTDPLRASFTFPTNRNVVAASIFTLATRPLRDAADPTWEGALVDDMEGPLTFVAHNEGAPLSIVEWHLGLVRVERNVLIVGMYADGNLFAFMGRAENGRRSSIAVPSSSDLTTRDSRFRYTLRDGRLIGLNSDTVTPLIRANESLIIESFVAPRLPENPDVGGAGVEEGIGILPIAALGLLAYKVFG